MHQANDVVILDGARTPFIKFNTLFGRVPAVELGRVAVREAIERSEIDPGIIDEVVMGNIAGPSDAANIARVVSLLAKVPKRVPAFTVSRNCASGLESIVEAAYRIQAGHAHCVVAGAVESMSRIPLLFRDAAQDRFTALAGARGAFAKIGAISKFRPKHFAPVIALQQGLTDPISGLNMGETAEVLAREFEIDRETQDAFALESHQKTTAAWEEGRLADEVVPVPVPPKFKKIVTQDNGHRPNQSMEALAKLRPVFDRKYGSVTAGNSSQLTDGAAALVLASRARAQELRAPILGTVRAWAFAGCDPARMGLGPVFATPIAFKRAGVSMAQMDLVEINEAFAAQVIACLKAFDSPNFATKESLGNAVGAPNPEKLNVNGGAIALGHPVGATGGRLVLTALHEMKRRNQSLALVTLCIGGGQGGAMVLERN